MTNSLNNPRKTPQERIVTYLVMRRYYPTTVELIAKGLFMTRSTVRRHLARLVAERVVLEHGCRHSTFREGRGTCYRMMRIPRKRS